MALTPVVVNVKITEQVMSPSPEMGRNTTVAFTGYIGGTDHGQAAGWCSLCRCFPDKLYRCGGGIRLSKIFGFEDAAIAAASAF